MKILLFRYRFLLLALISLIIAIVVNNSALPFYSKELCTSKFNKELQNKDIELEKTVSYFANFIKNAKPQKLFIQEKDQLEKLYNEQGISIFVFEDDSMAFWSHNAVPVLNSFNLSELSATIVRLQTGWYRVNIQKEKNLTVAGLALIKSEYTHQNQYLQDHFQKDFSLPENTQLNFNQRASENHVFDSKGKFLFTLIYDSAIHFNQLKNYFVITLVLLVVLFLILFFQNEIVRRLKQNQGFYFLLFSITLIVGRVLTIQTQFPGIIYSLDLFSPVHYATSWAFPSMGDFLVNALLLCYLFYFINQKMPLKSAFVDRLSIAKKDYLGLLVVLLVLAFALLITMWLSGLVLHSDVLFNLSNIFELNYLSLTGYFIASLLLFAFYLLCDKAMGVLLLLKIKNTRIAQLVLFAFLPFALLSYQESGSFDLILLIWPLPVLFTIWWIKTKQNKIYNFSTVLIIVLVFSIYASHVFNSFSSFKEIENRRVLVQKLAREKDPIAEYLFKEIEEKISVDKKAKSLSSEYWKNREELDTYLKENYFNGFWDRYDLQVTVCREQDSLFVAPMEQRVNCAAFFENLINVTGEKVNGSNLYFLDNNSGRVSYLAKLTIHSHYPNKNTQYLFLEIDSKFKPEGTGYPELLLDASEIVQSADILNYSFAKYKDGKLVSKSGPYQYTIFSSPYLKTENDLHFFKKEGFDHLVYSPESSTSIILSLPSRNGMHRLTAFSYIFAFFSLLLLLVLFFKNSPSDYTLFWFDFKTRIQSVLIGTVILSILLFGAGTVYYIQKQYNQKNSNLISEKISSIINELEDKIGLEPKLNNEMEHYLSLHLVKLSHVFYTDINLYSPNGDLLASSQNEIFNLGLSGRKMNTNAFFRMAIENNTEFIQEENLGKLNYISAYMPLFNTNGELIAYLNLPYFAKQNELEKEISFFLVTLINIYVLLFVMSVVIAVFLSGFITGPLQLIRTKLRDVKLGKSNELIAWKGNDEIGSLVNEYNQMIVKIAESAERLAQSERESAWREMAKQVAHEIKNPLTPMKLSVQHLERARKDKAPDFDKKLERFTQTLVEQIDTLANIANEFSSFAKMPGQIPEPLDISELVQGSVNLFKGSEEAIIELEILTEIELTVKADKNQLLRVFNNLIKNAIQSIPYERQGKIEIKIDLESKANKVLISIKDNGSGISAEQKEKIFTPNFTTKTNGTGLGLAIVKNIVEDSGGEIWFETKEMIGTVFYIKLPLLN
ncbi:MAG: GHKL domain-containing protein [Bacteroidetes bacterium]|nr:GHKL domain-containing protein [Bacteroidota bacterium]HET6242950.1 HAMP domain-containing sensor histidine kinase [Bacteroidia bacterium]